MTDTARFAAVVLLLGSTVAILARAVATPPALGPPRPLRDGERCEVPIEEVGRGVRCLSPALARAAGAHAGDTLASDGARGRMSASRLALLDVAIPLEHASTDEIASLPGIGPRLAGRIATAHPRSLDELEQIRGIGRHRAHRLAPRLLFADQSIEGQAEQ